MGVKRVITGVPYHHEVLTKKEDDPKRHKRRCEYFKADNNCGIYGGKCRGSAHCPYYSELNQEELKTKKAVKTQNSVKAIKSVKKTGEDDCFYYK